MPENNVNYLFEASVGGGIPIIRPLKQCLATNQIWEIYGILNGTTNYIIDPCMKAGLNFEEALKRQRKRLRRQDQLQISRGMMQAERLQYSRQLHLGLMFPTKRSIQGIDEISHTDILYAKELDHSIKLIAGAKNMMMEYLPWSAPCS